MDQLFQRTQDILSEPLLEKLLYNEQIEKHASQLVEFLFDDMRNFLQSKSCDTPSYAFAMTFQLTSWLFRQNPRVVEGSWDQRHYLPNLALHVQGLWKKLRQHYLNGSHAFPQKLSILVDQLAAQPCSSQRFYRETMNWGLSVPNAYRFQLIPADKPRMVQFNFSDPIGNSHFCDLPLDQSEIDGLQLVSYQGCYDEAVQQLDSTNPHVRQRAYKTVSFFHELYWATPKTSPAVFERLLLAFPDALLCARDREGRVALIHQFDQFIKRACTAYPAEGDETVAGLFLKHLDDFTARDGNQVLRLLSQSLFQLRDEQMHQAALKLWETGLEQANDAERGSWEADAAKNVGDIATYRATHAIAFMQRLTDNGLLSCSNLGEALVHLKKPVSDLHPVERSLRLEQLAEIVLKCVKPVLQSKQEFPKNLTPQMLCWLMLKILRQAPLTDEALENWVEVYYACAKLVQDQELLRSCELELFDKVLVSAQKNKKGAALTLCCQIGIQVAAGSRHKESMAGLRKMPKLLADLPESERTETLCREFRNLVSTICRAGFPSEFYFEFLEPMRTLKVPEVLEAKGELCLKGLEKRTRVSDWVWTLVGELVQGPSVCVRQASALLEHAQKRKMLADSQYQKLLNRICRAIWESIDDNSGNPDDIVEALKMLKECFRSMPLEERRPLFAKALNSLFLLADRNGFQAQFNKAFPDFMDLLDSDYVEYVFPKSKTTDLPPFLDIQFAQILLEKLSTHRELAPLICDSILKRLEKILGARRVHPFAKLKDPAEARRQIVALMQRMIFEATPAAWSVDQTTLRFQRSLANYEDRLSKIRIATPPEFYERPLEDFIYYLMLPHEDFEEDPEEEFVPISDRTFIPLLTMMRGRTHPWCVKKFFEITRLNKQAFLSERAPQMWQALEALPATSNFQRVEWKDDAWMETLSDIASLPEGLQDDAALVLVRLKLYQAFNRFLISYASPREGQMEERGELRWFRQALICYQQAAGLQILTCNTPECHLIVLEILQELKNCLEASPQLANDQNCRQILVEAARGPLRNPCEDERVRALKRTLSPAS